jgi:hypothetical protein
LKIFKVKPKIAKFSIKFSRASLPMPFAFRSLDGEYGIMVAKKRRSCRMPNGILISDHVQGGLSRPFEGERRKAAVFSGLSSGGSRGSDTVGERGEGKCPPPDKPPKTPGREAFRLGRTWNQKRS